MTPGPAAAGARWLGRNGARAAGAASRWTGLAFALPLALVAATTVIAINEDGHASAMKALTRLQQRAEATVQLQSVMRRLLDAESGQRGYMLTGRDAYLDPYREAAEDTRRTLDRLTAYFQDDAVSAALLLQLAPHARAKLDELAQSIAAYDAGDRARWVPLLDSASGRAHMDELRRLSAALLDRERAHIGVERQAVLDTLKDSRRGVNVTATVGVLALLLVLRKSAALDTIQRRQNGQLQAESERLEAEVQSRTADLSELARHLQTVRDDESSRLARELQQELGALLAATKMDLARLRHALAGAAPEVLARLDHLTGDIDGGIALKRRIIDHLRPAALANLGLVTALQIQLRDFGERSGVAVHDVLQDLEFTETVQVTIYRLVQEALTNIAKYAQARHVEVRLAVDESGHAMLAIADDGRGFDPKQARRGAHGLHGMRYRVEAAGGDLRIVSAPGRGTRIEARLPLAGGLSAGSLAANVIERAA